MKNLAKKISLLSLVILLFFSCKKNEIVGSVAENSTDSAIIVADSATSKDISMAASQEIEGKKFLKNAQISMEVKEVYAASIAIEKELKNLGGFVTSSKMNATVLSENVFPINDADAKLVRKFQQINDMEVRVPTEKLAEFLAFINQSNVFLHYRNITAEDVSGNIMIAKLEENRTSKTENNIEKIKNNGNKVNLANENYSEQNQQKLASFQLSDQLKYSIVNINLTEPNSKISTIVIANTRNKDRFSENNFLYEVKNAASEGFYLILKMVIGLLSIWPILLIAFGLFFLLKRRNKIKKIDKILTNE